MQICGGIEQPFLPCLSPLPCIWVTIWVPWAAFWGHHPLPVLIWTHMVDVFPLGESPALGMALEMLGWSSLAAAILDFLHHADSS